MVSENGKFQISKFKATDLLKQTIIQAINL